MKLAIMQPYLFPYIGYFQLLKAVDKFVLLDDVNYINKGWINRNRMLMNGKDFMFTVPLIDASQNRLIMDIDVEANGKWRSKLIKTFEASYKKAPFYNDVMPLIEGVINAPFTRISEIIYKSLADIGSYLQLTTEFIKTSSSYNINGLKGEARIIQICKFEKASDYINLIGGKELYSQETFRREAIDLKFLRAALAPYPQFGGDFVAGLSIVDVMMFNEPSKINVMLDLYTLE